MGTPLLVGGPGLQQGQQPIIPGKKKTVRKSFKKIVSLSNFFLLKFLFLCYDNEEESDIN